MAKAKDYLRFTVDEIRDLFYIKDGVVFNKVRRMNSYADMPAGSRGRGDYVNISVLGRQILKGHRVAWCLHYGRWPYPGMEIDHRDGNRLNNRIENLREVTGTGNCQNVSIRRDNTSGFIGVGWVKSVRRWRAYINVNGNRRNLGYFNDPEEGYAAYLKAKAELHTYQPVPREGALVRSDV